MDRPGRRRRHARTARRRSTTCDHPPEYTRPPVIPALDVLARRLAAGRRRVPRGPALEGRRLRAGRPGWSGSPSGSSRWRSRPTARGWPSPAAGPRGWARSRSGTSPSGSSLLSVPVTFDTRLRRELVARRHQDRLRLRRQHACGPSTPRPAQQVLFMGSHSDWALDTVFSADGSHLISVGRDMTAKLTEVATQRFVDNITSITPGALKGGLGAVARHPEARRDRHRRLRRRAQALPRLPPDGPRHRRRLEPDPRVPAAARPGLQRRGQRRRQADRRRQQPRRRRRGRRLRLRVRHQLSRQASRRSSQKVVTARSAAENADARQVPQGGRQADRQRQGAAGRRLRGGLPARRQGRSPPPAADGIVRLHRTPRPARSSRSSPRCRSTGRLGRRERAGRGRARPSRRKPSRPRRCPRGAAWRRSRSSPRRSASPIGSPTSSSWSPARLASGETIDATRMVEPTLSAPIAEVSRSGLVRPRPTARRRWSLRPGGPDRWRCR